MLYLVNDGVLTIALALSSNIQNTSTLFWEKAASFTLIYSSFETSLKMDPAAFSCAQNYEAMVWSTFPLILRPIWNFKANKVPGGASEAGEPVAEQRDEGRRDFGLT